MKTKEIKREKNGRPTTVITNVPPYIGFVNLELLEGVKSEPVTEITDEIKRDITAMHKALAHGRFQNGRTGIAMAHAQVNMRPYAFFCVAADKEGQWDAFTVFNPKILEKGGRKHRHKDELCLSFPFREKAHVERAEKVKVQYQTITEKGELSEPLEEWLEGKPAQIFQHECEHIEGGHIYATPVL